MMGGGEKMKSHVLDHHGKQASIMLYTYMLVVIADERDRTRSQNVQRNVNDD
jgi:hypothetical protein